MKYELIDLTGEFCTKVCYRHVTDKDKFFTVEYYDFSSELLDKPLCGTEAVFEKDVTKEDVACRIKECLEDYYTDINFVISEITDKVGEEYLDDYDVDKVIIDVKLDDYELEEYIED